LAGDSNNNNVSVDEGLTPPHIAKGLPACQQVGEDV
jgi:hypothetical protein